MNLTPIGKWIKYIEYEISPKNLILLARLIFDSKIAKSVKNDDIRAAQSSK